MNTTKTTKPTIPLSYTEQRVVSFALLHGVIHAALNFNMTERQVQALKDRAMQAMLRKPS